MTAAFTAGIGIPGVRRRSAVAAPVAAVPTAEPAGGGPAAGGTRDPARAALRVPAFRRYLGVRGLALLGNAMSLVAMPLLAYRLTGSAALTALVASGTFWPYLVLGLPAGALADRWDRRRVMVSASLAGAAVLATVPAAALAGALSYPHLLIAELVVASLFVFSDAAAFGALPELVGRSRLASATTTLTILHSSVMLAGPALAGVLIAAADPALVIAVDAGTFLLVALLLSRLRWAAAPAAGRRRSMTGDVVEGLQFIWRHQVIRWLTVFGFGASLAFGGVGGLLVVVGVEQVGLAADAQQLGWIYAASALGTLLGSALLAPLQRLLGVGLITAGGLLLSIVLLVALATAHSLPSVLVLVALFQIPLMALIVNGMVVRSVLTPDRLQSRVNTTARMVAGGGGPFGAVLAGAVAEAAGTEWALRAVGAGLLVSLIGVLIVGVHRYPRLSRLESDVRA